MSQQDAGFYRIPTCLDTATVVKSNDARSCIVTGSTFAPTYSFAASDTIYGSPVWSTSTETNTGAYGGIVWRGRTVISTVDILCAIGSIVVVVLVRRWCER